MNGGLFPGHTIIPTDLYRELKERSKAADRYNEELWGFYQAFTEIELGMGIKADSDDYRPITRLRNILKRAALSAGENRG